MLWNFPSIELCMLNPVLHYKDNYLNKGAIRMSAIGWIFLIGALALVAGSLLMLWKSARKMHIPEDKLDKVRKRKAELEAQEKTDDEW